MFTGLLEGVDFGQKEIMAKTNPSAREMIHRDFAAAYMSVVKEAKPVVEKRSEEVTPIIFEEFNSHLDWSRFDRPISP